MHYEVESEKQRQVSTLQNEIKKIEGDIEEVNERMKKIKDFELTEEAKVQLEDLQAFQQESRDVVGSCKDICKYILVS